MTHPNRKLSLAILLAASLPGCVAHRGLPLVDRSHGEVTREIVFPTTDVRELEIHAHQGLVVIRGGDTAYCGVDVEVVAEDRDAAERLAAGVGLSVRRPAPGQAVIGLEPGAGLRLDDVTGRWDVVVPPSVRVRIFSIDADVTVRDAQCDVDVETMSGRVRTYRASGPIHGLGDPLATAHAQPQ